MKLTFLGSGTAFSSIDENYNSNMVLESDSGKKLLIDCGVDIRHSSRDFGFSASDFDAVYISHFHSDHCGGLEWLALSRKFMANPIKPKLMIHPSMVDALWNHVLSAGLSTLDTERCDLDTFFEPYAFLDESHFHWEGIDFELVQTEHTYHLDELRPCYGLYISYKEHRLFITADTQYTPERFHDFYQQASIIFHDCETLPSPSGVHAHFDSLCKLPRHVKSKMWLYHYSKQFLPTHADDFLGFVARGQSFNFNT